MCQYYHDAVVSGKLIQISLLLIFCNICKNVHRCFTIFSSLLNISILQMKFVEEGLIRFHNFLQLFTSFWIKFTLMSLKTPNIFVRVSNKFCFTVCVANRKNVSSIFHRFCPKISTLHAIFRAENNYGLPNNRSVRVVKLRQTSGITQLSKQNSIT